MPAPSVREPIVRPGSRRCRNSSGSISGLGPALDDDEADQRQRGGRREHHGEHVDAVPAAVSAQTSRVMAVANSARPGPSSRRRLAAATRGCGTRWATAGQRHGPDGQVGLAPAAEPRTSRQHGAERDPEADAGAPDRGRVTPAAPCGKVVGQHRQPAGQDAAPPTPSRTRAATNSSGSRRHGAAERAGPSAAEPREVRRADARVSPSTPDASRPAASPTRIELRSQARAAGRPEVGGGRRDRRHRRHVGDQDERGARGDGRQRPRAH